MVEREFLRREDATAILTGIMVAQENVFARQALAFKGDVNVFDQPNDRRRGYGKSRRMHPLRRRFFSVGHAFQDQHDGTPHRADIDRLERSVEYPNACVHPEIEIYPAPRDFRNRDPPHERRKKAELTEISPATRHLSPSFGTGGGPSGM